MKTEINCGHPLRFVRRVIDGKEKLILQQADMWIEYDDAGNRTGLKFKWCDVPVEEDKP